MSSESATYMLTAIVGGLAIGLLAGFLLAWLVGQAAERHARRHAQRLRLWAGVGFLAVGSIFWWLGFLTFLADALLIGIGVGFLGDAMRCARKRGKSLPRAEA